MVKRCYKMKVKYENTVVLGILNLPKIYDLYSFSEEIGLSTTIIYLLSKKTDRYYNTIHIPKKKKGRTRQIDIPSFSMRIVQEWIKNKILDSIPISDSAMAFRKGKKYGIKKNAELHKNNQYILKLDFENFFSNINKEKVFYIFKSIGYNNTISDILTNICTYNKSLPQGAITSPSISNIVCKMLDSRLEGLSNKRNITYSRYADDLIFSSNDEVLLKRTTKVIFDIINDEGFYINKEKIRFIYPQMRKSITGLLIAENRVVVPKEMKRKVRAMIHNMIASADYTDIDKVKGYIAYISGIESEYIEKVREYVNKMIEKEQYKVFDDVVTEYNKNKLLKGTEDMELLPIGSCIEEDELGFYSQDFAEDYYEERIEFLQEKYPEKVKKLSITYKEANSENNEELLI
ncbi:RNA-directed DNA polymerase [Clostridium botulinum]|nr:RNA-directed DNA polymerase [Clostridium botulinum]NFL60528.1 RNA-directed DNA polymerase [Clostridium botulinum]NFL63752.1 RNA-directed DNA polymerase [Clostridium botulinum]NFO67269.1 RNA-directed DNA polymerase [Clostridium botulinum]